MALRIEVVTPEKEVSVADDVTLVIARGTEGDVGLMPGHTPILIALGVGPLVMVHESGDRTTVAVDGGFLDCHDDVVTVLAEFAVLPSEVDRAAVDAEVQELRRRLEAAAEAEDVRAALSRAELVQSLASR